MSGRRPYVILKKKVNSVHELLDAKTDMMGKSDCIKMYPKCLQFQITQHDAMVYDSVDCGDGDGDGGKGTDRM